jgi:hypothetical protein
VTKKKDNTEKVAKELADLVWKHLKTLPEEEQERRLSTAEGRLVNASRAGNRRTGRSRISRQGR